MELRKSNYNKKIKVKSIFFLKKLTYFLNKIKYSILLYL